MFTPKVKFVNISLASEMEWIYHFLFKHKWGWGDRVIKRCPKIKKVKSFKKKRDRVRFLKKYIVFFWRENRTIINKKKIKCQKEWLETEKNYFKLLSEIMLTDWPKNRKVIKAKISICPICPRFLHDWSFNLFYNFKIKEMIEVIMHECCHFLYFKKWKEMYPKVSRKTFNHPHIEWHLSELVAPIILNDKRVQELLKQRAHFYNKYSKIRINKKTAPEFFTKIYNKNIDKENGFELFLRQAYKEIKKHKKLFLQLK